MYADRENSANLAELTGFDPRFEEAPLVVGWKTLPFSNLQTCLASFLLRPDRVMTVAGRRRAPPARTARPAHHEVGTGSPSLRGKGSRWRT